MKSSNWYKRGIEELAIFGGPPAFDEALHVGRPNVGNRQRLLELVDDMLERRWLTNNGPYVQRLEQELSDFLQVNHCITVCNATIGLELAARAAGLSGEVIIPSFTFIATAHALQWQEITPVFADIDPRTHNIDPEPISRLITPRTSGILGVHIWGRPCNVVALEELAERYKLKLLFDAAHAFGCSYRGTMVGNFGNAEIFSFHATKFFNTYEGGAIATNDDALAEKIRLMRNFGFSGMDNVVFIGTNGKMGEAAAAMGLTSLDSLDEFIEVNRQNYEVYRRYLTDVPGIAMVTYDKSEQNNFQYIVVEVDKYKAGITRDELVAILSAENVLARRYFYPGCHRMEPYRSYYPNAGLLLPETEGLVERVMSLPTGTAVDEASIRQLCQIIGFVIENGQAVAEALRQGEDERG